MVGDLLDAHVALFQGLKSGNVNRRQIENGPIMNDSLGVDVFNVRGVRVSQRSRHPRNDVLIVDEAEITIPEARVARLAKPVVPTRGWPNVYRPATGFGAVRGGSSGKRRHAVVNRARAPPRLWPMTPRPRRDPAST